MARSMRILVDANPVQPSANTGVGWYATSSIDLLADIVAGSGELVLATSRAETANYLRARYPEPHVRVVYWRGKAFRRFVFPFLSYLLRPAASIRYDQHFEAWHTGRRIGFVHDLAYVARPDLYEPDDLRGQLRSFAALTAHCHDLCCVSQSTLADLRKVGTLPPSIRTHILYPVVPPPAVGDAAAASVVSQPYFLVLGLHHKRKNAATVLAAFRRVRAVRHDVRLVVTGAPVAELPDTIQLGYVNEEVKAMLLLNAAALVYVSEYEGFGIPVVEALHCGTPVIAARNSSLPEAGGEFCTYVDTHDVDGLAMAMTKAVERPARLSPSAALQRHLYRFSPERVRLDYLDLLGG